MTFEWALTALKAGGAVRRKKWPAGRYLEVEDGEIIMIRWTAQSLRQPWTIPHTALFADDWELA